MLSEMVAGQVKLAVRADQTNFATIPTIIYDRHNQKSILVMGIV